MHLDKKRDIVFLILAGFFVTNAVVGELIGGKLIQVGPFVMSIGVIPWPFVFITTDLINEYFGRKGVKILTLITFSLISYAFLIILGGMQVPAVSFSPVKDAEFNTVFGQSIWIIVGSLIAFAISQLVDVAVFWFFRTYTGGKMLWLRATGSTAVSQLFDSVIIIAIAFWLPGKIKTNEFINLAFTNYSYKFIIAIVLTPFIYFFHTLIDRYLGDRESHHLIDIAVKESIP